MIYLNNTGTSWYDEENEIIFFPGGEKIELKTTTKSKWKAFRELAKNPQNIVDLSKLKDNKNKTIYEGNNGSFRENVIKKLCAELNDKGLDCKLINEKDDKNIDNNAISIIVECQTNFEYSIHFPDLLFYKLINLFWKEYEYLSIKKYGTNNREEIVGKLGDVYRLPSIKPFEGEKKWTISEEDNYKYLINCPNGYGKTTLLKSILLSSSFKYIDGISEEEKKHYKKIRDFHGIKNNSLFIYLDCNFLNDLYGWNKENWIYQLLSHSMNLYSNMTEKDFLSLLKDYNNERGIVLLIDGFDEINDENKRCKLVENIIEFNKNPEFGNKSSIILAKRPLIYEKREFLRGYTKWTIESVNNEDEIKELIDNYLPGNKDYFNRIVSNYYLKQMACTPSLILWILRKIKNNIKSGYDLNGPLDVCSIIKEIIEEMFLRGDLDESLIKQINFFERVFELFSNMYLEKGIEELEIGIGMSYFELMVEMAFDTIIKEEKREMVQKGMKEKLGGIERKGELFFSRLGLLEERENNKLVFISITYAYYFAARRILRRFCGDDDSDSIKNMIDKIKFCHRYHVLTFIATIIVRRTQNRDLEIHDKHIEKCACLIKEYLIQHFNQANTNEKKYIAEAANHLLIRTLGNNLFVNENQSNNSESDFLRNLEFEDLTYNYNCE